MKRLARILDSATGRWLLLLAVVCPPLFAGLGDSDCEFHMEVRTMTAAQETWIRQQTDPGAWLIPSWNGAPRVNKPPLTVWLNMLVWTGLDPASAGVDQLVNRARLVAAALSVLGVLAVWGIGSLLHSSRFGLLAAAITGTSLLFVRNARMASYDTYLLAFSTFAVAAALWAMRPRGEAASPARAAAGWIACGLAIAAAFLTKGPISLVMTALPLALIAATGPRRLRDFAGLLAALAVAAALAAPWYLYVLHAVPAADQIMGTEFKAARTEFQPPWYYLCLIPLVAPWLLWLPAFGIAAARRQYDLRAPALRVAACWFLVILVVMSIPAAKQQRYILPILPATGLLIAAAWTSLAARNALRWPHGLARVHAGVLAVASLALGAWGLLHPWLISSGALDHPEIARLPAWSFALLALPLFALARAIARAADLEHAAWLTAIWMALAATPTLFDYAGNLNSRYPHRAAVESVMEIVGPAPLLYTRTPGIPESKGWPDPKMLLYSRRIIPEFTNATPAPGAFLMAARTDEIDRILRARGWQFVREFQDGNYPRRLYRAP